MHAENATFFYSQTRFLFQWLCYDSSFPWLCFDYNYNDYIIGQHAILQWTFKNYYAKCFSDPEHECFDYLYQQDHQSHLACFIRPPYTLQLFKTEVGPTGPAGASARTPARSPCSSGSGSAPPLSLLEAELHVMDSRAWLPHALRRLIARVSIKDEIKQKCIK